MSSLVDEDTVRSIKVQHSWEEQLSCACSVNDGTVPPIKNPEPVFTCIALVHSYVCLGCVCVCVGGWVGGWRGLYEWE